MRIATPIETARLRLRPFRPGEDDLEAMHAVLGDAASMRYYPAPLDRDGVSTWIAAQLERYARDGFGLLAIEDCATGGVLGDCGPTVQSVDVDRLVSLIRPENVASRRVAEKLGFEIWRGTIRAGWGHLAYRLDRP